MRQMHLRLKMLVSLLVLLIASTAFSGCFRTTLHPITDEDIWMEDDRICMTYEYVDEVLKLRFR